MRIHHIALSVWSLDASVKFYKDTFGFEEVRRFEHKELMGKAVFLKLTDGCQLEIWEFKDQREPKDDLSDLNIFGLKHIAIEIDDLETKHRELSDKGIKVSPIKQGTLSKYCFLKDPDGIVIELCNFNK
jgi:lactoylglutathione lyase